MSGTLDADAARALDTTDITAIRAKTDALPSSPANDATVAKASVLGTPAGASVSADMAALKTVADAVKAKTDNLPAAPAAVGSAMTLTAAYDSAKAAAQAAVLGTPAGASVAADIAAVAAKTANLPASPAATGDAMGLTAAAKQEIPRQQATTVVNAVSISNAAEVNLLAVGTAGGSNHYYLDSVYLNVSALGTQTLLTFKLYIDLNGTETLIASATDAATGVVSVLQLLQTVTGSGPIASRRVRLTVQGNSGVTPGTISGSIETRIAVA